MSNQQAKQIIGNILCYTALGFIIASQANRYWSIITTASGGFAAEVQYGLYQLCSSGFCINYGKFKFFIVLLSVDYICFL